MSRKSCLSCYPVRYSLSKSFTFLFTSTFSSPKFKSKPTGRIPKKWAKCILFDDRLKLLNKLFLSCYGFAEKPYQKEFSHVQPGQTHLYESEFSHFQVSWCYSLASIDAIAGNTSHLNFGLLSNLLKNQYIQMRLPCMSNDLSTKKEVNDFCSAIQAIFQRAQEICNSDQVISSAEQLEELEQKVGDLTDQLQAIIIEERLQSSLDSEEVRETEADLVANLP